MSKLNIFGYTLEELTEIMTKLGEKPFRGKQLFKWIYKERQTDFEQMTDFTNKLREKLSKKFEIKGLTCEKTQHSNDGTMKFLFDLDNGAKMETVLIPNDTGRRTVCISSQVGCALTCRFCATGTMGLMRNLSVGEIVGQLTFLRDKYGDDCFSNVVMMGMGEPLNNFDNVVEAIKIISSHTGLNFAPKRITLSTSGITPKIRKLADQNLKVNLALSLHAATQSQREKIMPVAQTFKLDKLMDALKYYMEKTRTMIMFEYIIFKDFNDTKEDVINLSKLVRGMSCKINILAYNPVDGLNFERPSDELVDWFGRELNPRVPAVTVRKSRGRDIDAACGQLAVKELTKEKN